MDTISKEQRSRNMSHIRSSETSIELILRLKLWRLGYRYRKNYPYLPGKPDIYFIREKLAIFCDSEFWHGKDIGSRNYSKMNNGDYWLRKISRNIARDHEVNKQLNDLGIKVLRFWGDEIRKSSDRCIEIIINHLDCKESKR